VTRIPANRSPRMFASSSSRLWSSHRRGPRDALDTEAKAETVVRTGTTLRRGCMHRDVMPAKRMNMFVRAVLVWGVVVAAAASCGGEILDGTCSPGDGGSSWSCQSTLADASGVATVFAQCPPNFDSFASCPASPPGFSGGVFSAGGADCFSCAENGKGTLWSCNSTRWEGIGLYTCTP
jgi:hypothetical protein